MTGPAQDWPDHLRLENDNGVLKITPAPWTSTEFWVICGCGIGIPALLLLFYPSIKAIFAGVLFFVAIAMIAFGRFRASWNLALDLPRQRILLSHTNPGLAKRIGIADRDIELASVEMLRLTSLMNGARYGAPGLRINLALADGSTVPVIDFAVASEGLKLARYLAATMAKSLDEGPFGDK